MRKLSGVAGIVVLVLVGFGFKPGDATAANKVDCTKVMSELSSGTKPKAVAQDMKISTSSVYRCRKKAHAAEKSSVKMTPAASSSVSPAH
ncbi:MAG: hypothetical protein JO166_12070 [Deltaproteobacteria bacterium]|nr:hypothetical protein [Deltaproteobacteria bacterium]